MIERSSDVEKPAATAPGAGHPQACPSCGASALTSQPTCELCGGSLAEMVALPPPVTGIHWVQVRLRATCAVCENDSPVGDLDGERFYCFSCAREMPFRASFWQDRLALASSSGALYRSRIDDASNIIIPTGCRGRLISAPGYPLCGKCHAALDAEVARGTVATTCHACGEKREYRAPEAALSACAALIGVVAPEHEAGRQAVALKKEPDSAAVAITCPNCGSALQLVHGERMTTCDYCHVESVVPIGVLAQAFAESPPDQPIWCAFRAPSQLRTEQEGATPLRTQQQADESREQLRGAEEAKGSVDGALTIGVVLLVIGTTLFIVLLFGSFSFLGVLAAAALVAGIATIVNVKRRLAEVERIKARLDE